MIKITEVPPGFAAENIRKEWVGVKIPLPTQEEVDADPPSDYGIGNDNLGGYLVFTDSAINALIEHDKFRASAYWRDLKRDLQIGKYLQFSKDCCRLIEE